MPQHAPPPTPDEVPDRPKFGNIKPGEHIGREVRTGVMISGQNIHIDPGANVRIEEGAHPECVNLVFKIEGRRGATVEGLVTVRKDMEIFVYFPENE